MSPARPEPSTVPPPRDAVRIPGGKALVGTASPLLPADGEGPPRHRRVAPFLCARGTVTMAEFAAFVDATGYVTEAERFGWSFVFHLDLPGGPAGTQGIAGQEWWRRVDGASWRAPFGPEGRAAPPDHPVVQVSWADALAYAGWAGGRLPSEAEWEHAARGGQGDVRYPWGDRAPDDTDFLPCNIWQGDFPRRDTGADGHAGTAPALSFAPNGYGLHNMVGNVWEWTREPFRIRSVSPKARQPKDRKLLKGGSWMCHASYCHRYRIAARTGNSPDSTSGHTGFRLVFAA